MEQRRQIGKVLVDASLYTGNDAYTDGQALEEELLTIAKSDQDPREVIGRDHRWPVLYHFSPIRENLLDWYDFGKESTVLEIGAGCGAVTGALCRTAGHVTALDLSEKRSLVNAWRHRDANNLTIHIANFQAYQPPDLFDYVTLIGVLEYAASYLQGEQNAYLNMLRKIRDMLKPNGQLILAIENQLGLKYWAGAPEDHTGKLFDGLEGYSNNAKARTFSKYELTELLRTAGFVHQTYYYPFPDYKLPTQIYSDDFLPTIGSIHQDAYNYDQEWLSLFNENEVRNSVIAANVFPEFSNSFLVFAAIGG